MPDDAAGPDEPPAFWCDAMLGGLARWLRAAGYDAAWEAGIADAELARHGAIRAGRIRALWIPPGLEKLEQLRYVVRSMGLAPRAPRCMACGGALVSIPRESARPEAPPRTFAWCREFYRCGRCAKLFWRGTHWSRIADLLDHL